MNTVKNSTFDKFLRLLETKSDIVHNGQCKDGSLHGQINMDICGNSSGLYLISFFLNKINEKKVPNHV